MKIGILTYHNTRNCGAVLQAYALCKKLCDLGLDNEIIDYRCEKIEQAYKIKKLNQIKGAKEFIKWFLTIRNDKKSQKKFDAFKSKYLNLSMPYYKDTIQSANKIYNSFITGSDQVWNFKLNGDDFTYLLDFADNEKSKNSYAASMGSDIIDKKNQEHFKKSILSFDKISVRENLLREYVQSITKNEAHLVLDPTLLLNENDYNFESKINIKDKYIFVYTIAPTPHIESCAKALSKQTGYKIIWGHMSHRKKKGVVNKTDISPDEFINYIKNAQFVFTSSFHGMALSCVLKKQFFYDLDVSKNNNNSRLETLAKTLNLTSRELKDNNFNITDFCDIDYTSLNKTLKAEQDKSIDFLKSIN